MSDRQVSVERVIQADASTIFGILTDPLQHPVLDGSGTLQGNLRGPDELVMGSKFGMQMKIGPIPYVIRNTVVEYEPDRRIAWRHLHRHRWRYELEPRSDGGTLVRETFDWGPSLFPAYIEKAGYPEKHPEGMRRTLETLSRLAAERQAELDGDITG